MRGWPIVISMMLCGGVLAQSRSAADAYRGAAEAVPIPATALERQILANALEVPLTDESREFLRRCGKSLERFDGASQMVFGTWGFDPDDRLQGTRPLPRMGELAQVVCLRARVKSADANHSGGLDDCHNLASLARRMSVQASLVRMAQQQAIFELAMTMALAIRPSATATSWTQFIDQLDVLRSSADPVVVARQERDTYLWFHGQLIDDPTLRRLVSSSRNSFGELLDPKLPQVEVYGLFENPEQREAVFTETKAAFEEMILVLQSPSAERDAAFEAAAAKYAQSHALVRGACRIVLRIHHLDRSQEKMLARVKTAQAGPATIPSQ